MSTPLERATEQCKSLQEATTLNRREITEFVIKHPEAPDVFKEYILMNSTLMAETLHSFKVMWIRIYEQEDIINVLRSK